MESGWVGGRNGEKGGRKNIYKQRVDVTRRALSLCHQTVHKQ